MAKTFYKLTPKANKIARKLDKVATIIAENCNAIEELDINTVNLKTELDKSDVLYLFQQYGNQEFCDGDFHKDRTISFYQLEFDGYLKETYRDE